jgi:tetratricopeptide (TPR) repeat protein
MGNSARWRGTCTWLLASTLCVSTWCGAARAEDAAARAREHYERGYALARSGDFEQAIDEFKQAYAASPNFSVLFNLGQAYGASGRAVEAQRTLQRYLEVGGSGVDAEQRRRALELIDYYRRRIGRIDLTGLPSGARVSLDGEELGAAPFSAPIEAGAGRHAVSIQGQGYESLVRSVDVKAGEQVLLAIRLIPKANPAAPGACPQTSGPSCAALDAARYQRAKTQKLVALAVGGGAVLIGATAITLAVTNDSRYRKWRDQSQAFTDAFARDPASVSPAQLEALLTEENSIRNRDSLALGLGVAAGTLALTSVALYLTAGRSTPLVSVGPRGASLSYRASF